ncbi:SLATT domain-containing protein [Acinetobacter seifertii]|uniref:SLATT domain-containing protein n=1 Tax=Acinetobacter seifertii TaxID=1530123 RepID=UPI00083A8E31|nr:SLATT domain-containing protein [Acinetobacter seifertii]OCZ51821.1 hypothetical protein A7P21_16640 [Acinetobacter seifertii]
MTKEQLLHQIANIGYSTSYGRDKCYSTADIAGKTTWRFSIIGIFIALAILAYPILGNYVSIGLIATGIAIVAVYLRQYTDNKYIETAKNLETIERELQTLYFYCKNLSENNLDNAIKTLNKLDKRQKDISIPTQVFGSDWYAHVKMFWTKKINSQWFVDELKLKFFFDKLPFSFFSACILICILTLLLFIGFFIANYLIDQGLVLTYLEIFKGICK